MPTNVLEQAYDVQWFASERAGLWRDLEALLDRAGDRAKNLGPDGVISLGRLYRAVSADLAIARRRYPDDPVSEHLEVLVRRAHVLVYEPPSRAGRLRDFIAFGYWQRVRERPRILLLAIALLVGPALLAGVWGVREPGAAIGVVPDGFQWVTDSHEPGEDHGLSDEESAAFSSELAVNNTYVGLLAFAGGVLAGAGTALLLLYNGLVLGATVGVGIEAGNGPWLLQYVTVHGLLELSCIVVCGAAGMRMGWAFVSPGVLPRLTAFQREARASVEIVLGTVPFIAIAALTEGFVSPSGLSLPAALLVGGGLATLYWLGVLTLGRRSPRWTDGDQLPS